MPKSASRSAARPAGSVGGSGNSRWAPLGWGFALGMLSWVGLERLGLSAFRGFGYVWILPFCGVLGAALAVTRMRWILWGASILICASILTIGFTSLIREPVQRILRRDPLQRADAVVVLSSEVRSSGEMDSAFQIRVLHGYEVLRQGYAPRLIVTHLGPYGRKKSYVPAVRAQMRALGFDYPVDEVGPVYDTHDESLAVSALARKRGWKKVILVSDPTHLRRAGATFEKTGLRVLCSPCLNEEYDVATIRKPGDRLAAFREWIHEVVGYEFYRRHGWL